ncbi:transglutaminase-like domain-containing protein [Microbacterium sp. LRZ72]|uniref:transglutaminase-like domain-containing protein n=1 Tax=Microbacterium sp. LRZ72 TaxID=2942481 RepID=UPI0029B7142A|nr:transglutaminase-like domain-containing protein [Microbacterium sp. LRZ72]MDX2376637.1 transglutaminase-like domain-containing protein [Microbacterium sp. LRZ72]
MSSDQTRAGGRRERPRGRSAGSRRDDPRARIVAGVLYVATVTALAALAAWPIYRSVAFVVLVIVAATTGALIAVAARLLRWPGWAVVVVVTGAVLVLGVPLAVPSRLGSPGDAAAGLLDVLSGAVTAWKDLLTVTLPVGEYRNLLVPALLVFLVGVTAALLLAWRRPPVSAAAVVVGLAMVGFGLLFGRTQVSADAAVGPLVVSAPVETATGALGLVASLAWLAWQAHEERARTLRRAASTSGVRVSRSRRPSDARRLALGAAMVVAAVAVGAIVAPAAAGEQERTVLRSGVGPQISLTDVVSPLAQYRGNFADASYDEVLFRVDVVAGTPDRVRLAALDAYDGVVFRAGDGEGDGRYLRVPSLIDVDAAASEPFEATVTIDGLDGIWMPTLGRLASIEFAGARPAALADGFYYSRAAAAGIQVAEGGVRAGDVYRLTGVVPPASALEEATAPVGPGAVPGAVEAPESLRVWLERHVTGTDGAALAQVVALLRERGYLSHAVHIDPDDPPAWLAEGGATVFQPSAAGHSLARIDALFRALLEREDDAREGGADESLVAAPGDDEQFAVAAALLAQELGFPARVVVGTRLTEDEALPVCEQGTCRGSDIAAWAEVLTADGEWIAIDATPQQDEPAVADRTRQRDPENPTQVRPEGAEQVVPPDPEQQDTTAAADEDPAAWDAAALWRVARVAGIALLSLAVLAAPFATVLLAKALRRRSRREAADPTGVVVGAWEEYADAAADHGRPVPGGRTRAQVAELHASDAARTLAERADRAVFAPLPPSPADAAAVWRLVDAERSGMRAAESLWHRARAAVSLRSFTRLLVPSQTEERGRSEGGSGRRRRRPADAAKSS